MNNKDKIYIIVEQSSIATMIKNIVTFLMFIGTMYFNHKILSGNAWIDFVLICIIVSLVNDFKTYYKYRGDKNRGFFSKKHICKTTTCYPKKRNQNNNQRP